MQAVYRDADNRVIDKGEVVDLRNLSSIHTDLGDLLIKGAAASTGLRRILSRIVTFVSEQHGGEVLKIVA
jgi:hypothetical protein